jgi:putative membrane protein
MKHQRHARSLTTCLAMAGFAAGLSAPSGAVSLPAVGVDTIPEASGAQTTPMFAAADWYAGSAALVPVVAADAQAIPVSSVDAPAGAEKTAGKPIDDVQFVRQAAERGRHEIQAARDALPQLHDPGLKEIAGMLVADHGDAHAKLARIAESRGWPLPAAKTPAAPPSGTSAADFDAKWTAEMIANHERTVALYRAQASGGEDRELRRFATDTLPTIERHLAHLRSLQK